MKKYTKLLLCLSTITLLVGCGNNQSSGSNNDSSEKVNSNIESSNPNVESNSLSSEQTDDKVIVVNGVELPASFVEFNYNNSGATSSNRSRFIELNKDRLVGDDNQFNVKPAMTFLEYNLATDDTKEITVDQWEYEIKVSLVDDNPTDVTLNSSYVESIDNVNCLIDFAEGAIDHKFDISVVPTGLTKTQKEDIADYTMNVSVKVVDGYNVYNAKELAYINNSVKDLDSDTSTTTINEKVIWDAFKVENNLQLDYYPSTFVLQNNIAIENTDIPSEYFLSEEDVKGAADYDRALGSLKDWNTIYHRYLNDKESINIYGNYFTLDASKISVVIRDGNTPMAEDATIISHTNLFRFRLNDELEDNDDKNTTITASSLLSDINLVGNSPRQENTTLSGGLIMNKSDKGVMSIATNNIAKCWFITYFNNNSPFAYSIDGCKCYDNFNSFLYNWGGVMSVKDSEFIGAGGPIVIQDHTHQDDNGQGGEPPFTSFENSVLQSYVTGKEGWFKVVGASSLIPNILALDAIFQPAGKSFLKTSSDGSSKFFNLICVNKSSSAETITALPNAGNLTLKDQTVDYSFNYGLDNPIVNALCYNLELMKARAPIFETSNGGYGFFNGEYLLDAMQQPIMDPTDNIFSGEYLCTYISGMALVFGYNTAGEIYTPISE